ncbi:DENN domain-containing protein [Zalerion maritima]|uniref:DENN domain-containing protein n=1 Tax=Zalerion maritima TaxID=339359 RepID=A0AAD5WXK5_9PEZI|nr:DENN domain-containing protein [Zalerion maritima]
MDNPSTPLADYFWIAGVESISYQDTPLPQPPQQGQQVSMQVESTIAEDRESDSDPESRANNANSTTGSDARHSKHNANRLSKSSVDSRTSIRTVEELDVTRSNRSSATIRANPPPPFTNTPNNLNGSSSNSNGQCPSPGGLGILTPETTSPGFDFDQALYKFAAERENFLDDLTFSSGAKVQSRPPMISPRVERIKADEDVSLMRNPIRSIKGSIRRKISFRDMNSTRRQPPATRTASVRTSRTAKRMSNYNSVIPPPEPLNTDPDMHPLKRRFEPVLLDRYPSKSTPAEEISRRGKFPDYVPMFAFPNDIQICSSDDRPRSTWHGFTMTGGDGSKIYGVTIIVWTALASDVAEEVEKRCELWRQGHMSSEEREMAASLGVRLAAERAHLSQLLSKLPSIPSGSSARETLDDKISAVEEKIALMTEMLRPLRHGAASKIDGLTTGETGLWTPRAFGVLGRDAAKIGFWKEWLRAVIVPMTDGAVLRVPPSSPRVGRWQPLERYVVNLCTEAFSPISSKTQVEIGVRELRLYARKEAVNELPGSRTTDIYALFRCLSLENIVALFEFAMSESRIIFLSSHTAMLHLACHALTNLLYPLEWASVFIPVLPVRLLSVLEAPCPYIVGVERRYEKIDLPDDDYVLVDLDQDTIDSTTQPVRLPRQFRRKLMSLLQAAAPHHLRYGVPTGPPPYAMEAYPYDAHCAENDTLFIERVTPSTLGKWVTQSSTSFGQSDPDHEVRPPIFNAFVNCKHDGKSERPATSKSGRTSPPSSVSPVSINFPPMPGTPGTPTSRTDSGFGGISATLREKRSGHFDERSRRSSSFGVNSHGPLHRPSLPFLNGHSNSMSVSAISVDSQSSRGGYAPSTYAPSTLAASTVMPNMLVHPVQNTEKQMWVEGHCFNWTDAESSSSCHVCDERSDGDGLFHCSGCGIFSHHRCLGIVSVVCPQAFHPDRVRAAFVRCQASLLYTYRKYLGRPSKEQRKNGQMYAFDMDSYVRSLPYEQQEYANMMKQTQAFNEFWHERETAPASSAHIRLFDEIILAKKSRGRAGGISSSLSRLSTIRMSHGASSAMHGLGIPARQGKAPGYLTDDSDHLWRTASVPVPVAKFPGEYRTVVTRIPSRLDPSLMKEPRAIQGVPRPEQRGTRGLIRKQVPSMMLSTTPPGI